MNVKETKMVNRFLAHKPKKMGKKGMVDAGPLTPFINVALGALVLVVVLVVVYVFLAQSLQLDIVSSDTQATAAITKVRTAVNVIPDLTQLIIYAVALFAVLAAIVLGGVWGYRKMGM